MKRHETRYAFRSVALVWLLLLAGCAGPDSIRTDVTRTIPGHEYVLAILTTGARAGELHEEAVAAASTGHRAHIESMGADGTLLLAGPFGEPRANESWRGLYVFDLTDMEKARDLTLADPSVVAGLFDLKLFPWRSDVDLRPMRDELERGKLAGEPFVPGAYVLAIGTPAERARDVLPDLAGEKRIICAGELGGERQGEFLVLLTAETVEEAEEWLDSGDSNVSWGLSSLWATALLVGIAEGR